MASSLHNDQNDRTIEHASRLPPKYCVCRAVRYKTQKRRGRQTNKIPQYGSIRHYIRTPRELAPPKTEHFFSSCPTATTADLLSALRGTLAKTGDGGTHGHRRGGAVITQQKMRQQWGETDDDTQGENVTERLSGSEKKVLQLFVWTVGTYL